MEFHPPPVIRAHGGIVCLHRWLRTARTGAPVNAVSICRVCARQADAEDVRVWKAAAKQSAGAS